MKGSQSARLDVVTESRTADVADSVPEAWMWEVGVARVNWDKDRASSTAW
jgi:hypothetical protein